MIYEFEEILNDFNNYFLLADLNNLNNWRKENGLPENLAIEFTSNDSGNDVASEAVMIPLNGIENYPYIILFNFTSSSILEKNNNKIQFKKEDNSIEIKSSLSLFTWPLLNDVSDETIRKYLSDAKQYLKPTIEVDEGFYNVTIIGGESLKESGYEPTIEFMFLNVDEQEYDNKDLDFQYTIIASEY